MAKKKKKKKEVPLAKLKLQVNVLGAQIQRLKGKQWDVAWEIAQRECPVEVGQVIRKPAFSRRYVVVAIESLGPMADERKLVTWVLRVAVINKDGTRRRRSRHETVYPNELRDNYLIEEDTAP